MAVAMENCDDDNDMDALLDGYEATFASLPPVPATATTAMAVGVGAVGVDAVGVNIDGNAFSPLKRPGSAAFVSYGSGGRRNSGTGTGTGTGTTSGTGSGTGTTSGTGSGRRSRSGSSVSVGGSVGMRVEDEEPTSSLLLAPLQSFTVSGTGIRGGLGTETEPGEVVETETQAGKGKGAGSQGNAAEPYSEAAYLAAVAAAEGRGEGGLGMTGGVLTSALLISPSTAVTTTTTTSSTTNSNTSTSNDTNSSSSSKNINSTTTSSSSGSGSSSGAASPRLAAFDTVYADSQGRVVPGLSFQLSSVRTG